MKGGGHICMDKLMYLRRRDTFMYKYGISHEIIIYSVALLKNVISTNFKIGCVKD